MVTFFGWDSLGYPIVLPADSTEKPKLRIAEYDNADKAKWTASSERYKSAMRATALNLLKCPEKPWGKATYWVGETVLKPTYVKCQTKMPELETESEDEDNSEDAYSSSEEDKEEDEGEDDSEEQLGRSLFVSEDIRYLS